jgi:hypothetical protein
MRIAFDLDGVVLHQEMYSLKAIDSVQNEQERAELMRYYYSRRSIQLNPIDYLADDDELFFITGRSVLVEDITRKWAKKYFPMATVITTRTILPSSDKDLMTKNYVKDKTKEWGQIQAERKAKALNDNSIDVFFEDAPDVVKHLRQLCKNTKIVQFGGRF